MVRKVAPLVVAILMGLCAAPAAHATEPFNKVGFFGGAWLKFPMGVRNIGMGATGTSDASGLATGYFNPASVAWSGATTLVGSYENFNIASLGMTLSQFQVFTPFPFHSDSTGEWHFAGSLGYSRLGMDDQTERTIFLPGGTGARTFSMDDWMASALVASQWQRGSFSVGAGVNGKYIYSSLGSDHSTIWSFDAGVIVAAPVAIRTGMIRPRIGYAQLNLDNGASVGRTTYSVETEKRIGVGLDLDATRFSLWHQYVPAASLSADYDMIDRESGPDPNYAAGIEVSFLGLIHARYGVLDNDYTMYGAGAGWDFGNVIFRLDFAHTRPEDASRQAVINLERDTVGGLIGVRW